MRIVLYITIFFLQCLCTVAQELVINGGAEADPWSLPGWTHLNPLDQWEPTVSQGTVLPRSGSNFFFPNKTIMSISELYQDIDLSSNAAAIDAGTASYTFSGWRRGYPGTDSDQSQIIVEYKNASGTVIASFITVSADFNSWTNDLDTRNAPVGTRSVRIRLISTRLSRADNDGYYDDISFVYNTPVCTAPASIQLTPNVTTSYCIGSGLLITGAATPVNPRYYYTWYHNGNPVTTASQTYTSISKATSSTSDAGIYTLRVEDGNAGSAACYTESSVTIILDQPVIAGTITAPPELCYKKILDPITGTPSTGGSAAKYYKWQRSNGSSTGPWVDVQAFDQNATGFTPNPLNPAMLQHYRRIDSSGTCPNTSTNTISIRLKNPAPLAPITSQVRDTLCIGENFRLIPHLQPPGAYYSFNGGFYYTWRKAQGTTSEIVVPTSPMTSFYAYPSSAIPAAISDSGTYYFIIQDGAGISQCKDSVKIVIRINQPPAQKALIQNHQEFCSGTPASQLTELRPAAGLYGTPLYHQWYTTSDTTGTTVLSKIAGASTGINYTPGTLSATTYYVRTDSVKYCPAVKTNFVKIRLNNSTVLDSIRPTVYDTLCENYGDQFQLKGYIDSLTAGKQSNNGGFYFTWKKLQQPNTSAAVISAAAPYKDYPVISRPVVEADSGTYYLIVQDGVDATKCLDSISFKVVVIKTCVAVTCTKPYFVSIKTTSGNTLCSGTSLVLQKDVLTLSAVPPAFGYIYSWVRTNTLGSITVQTSAAYQDLVINSVSSIDSGRYQLIVRDGTSTPALCAESSLPISIAVQDRITQSLIGNDTTVCRGYPTSPFAEITVNTGGTGTYTYQWEQSVDEGLNFTNIPGATNSVYQSLAAGSKTLFRRIVASGVCPVSVSNTITVYVTDGVQPGSITSANTTVCSNTSIFQTIASLSASSLGSGDPGSATYFWQKSTDNSLWTDIPGTNTETYTETNPLSTTTYYRRCVSMGPAHCDTAYTNTVAIHVSVLTTGSIGYDHALCSNSSAVISEITGATGNNIHYQWIQSSNLGRTWEIAEGTASLNNYQSPKLSATRWYKRLAISSCGQDSSNIVKIDIIPMPIVSAGNDTTVSKNSVIQLQGNVIGTTDYVWTPSAGRINPYILKPDATITNTITYTLSAQDATGMCQAQSDVIIRVKSQVVIPNVITPNGDGANDTWSIEGIENYPNAAFTIYNRWGNIVWKASGNVLEWNGTNYRNGELLADGTYFYIIDLKDISYTETLTGYVQLMRL
jgi:gliding motility-associated-like protein